MSHPRQSPWKPKCVPSPFPPLPNSPPPGPPRFGSSTHHAVARPLRTGGAGSRLRRVPSPPPPRGSGPRGATAGSRAAPIPRPRRAQPALLTHLLPPALSVRRRSSCGQYVGGDGGRERTNRRSLGRVSAPRAPASCSICILGGLGPGARFLKGPSDQRLCLRSLSSLPHAFPATAAEEILRAMDPPPVFLPYFFSGGLPPLLKSYP